MTNAENRDDMPRQDCQNSQPLDVDLWVRAAAETMVVAPERPLKELPTNPPNMNILNQRANNGRSILRRVGLAKSE